MEHKKCQPNKPLYMIIQGTTGTRKSYLIHCIRNALNNNGLPHKGKLLVLAPIGVSAFNIHASTIDMVLKIPIKQMQRLQGQALTTL